MEETEEETKQNEGVIKTVASPTVLAAILNDSVEADKQTLKPIDNNSQEEKCLHSSEPEKIPPLEMDESQQESSLDDSFLADSLECDERSQNSYEETEKQKFHDTSSSIADNSTLIENTTRENTENIPKDYKPLNKSVKNNPIFKQKPKDTNFIDLNKGRLNRTSGKSSYAAMYSQKLKQKQENPKKQEKESEVKGKIKSEQSEKQLTYSDPSKQYSYSSVQERTSSLSNVNPNYEKSEYYNVDPAYLQTSFNNNYALPGTYQPVTGYNHEYLTQPYHAPYRDFGLRYSNHGHQSYMASSAVGYRPSNNMHANQIQGYSSQSAPPGAPGRLQPLLDQVEFFPEQEYLLSQSLTNSQFINPMQMYQTDSVLDRRFVSEPQLMSAPYTLEKGKDNDNNNSSRKPVDYKPYTLKDYKQLRNDTPEAFGGLGPETESEEYREKISKLNKQKEYAEMLRLDHAARKKQWAKKPAVVAPTSRQQQAEAKRQAAINYARSIPKPKLTDQRKEPNQVKTIEKENDVPLIEVLRMRHIQEKRQVEAIKKELITKTQN